MAPIYVLYRGHVNVLDEGRAGASEIEDVLPMVETWRERLATALKSKGLSKRRASLAAGMSSGYIHGLLKEGKEPTVENLLSVCRTNAVSDAYVILGYEVPPDVAELFELWAKAEPATRQGILQILASRKVA